MSGIRAGIKNVHIDSDIEDHKAIYKYTSWKGGELTARIEYNNDGSINADNTYSEWYLKKHKLGRFAKSDDDDAKKRAFKSEIQIWRGELLTHYPLPTSQRAMVQHEKFLNTTWLGIYF